jgi:AraC-like DNA-binding protein
MAPYELTRRFSAEFGMTPSAYRRHARLQRAIQMLSEGAAHLAQIANAAGYHDQSHLTLELRREVGLTPGALRRFNA